MEKLVRFALIASLAFGANVASAIPLTVTVETLSAGGSAGSWSLEGPTSSHGDWLHLVVGSSSWDLDIAPGVYDWSITGGSLGLLGGVGWNLRLNGQEIYRDSKSGLFVFKFDEDYSFTATAVSVPEPATLTMLGLGLGLLGLARVRRRRA